MTRQTSQPHQITDTGSDVWHPDTDGRQQRMASDYLDQLSAMPLLRIVAEQTMALLAVSSGDAVVEVGCGNGAFLPLLARAVGPHGTVLGIDHAPAFVDEAQARIAADGLDAWVTVQVGDAYDLPVATASLDAAHCERVLMHLDDPTAALHEMRRVVRPGGRIVAVEPDWAGVRIDHPDPVAFGLLFNHYCAKFRQPDVGSTLYRRFAEIGFVEREVVPMFSVTTDYTDLQRYGMDLAAQVEQVVTAGFLSKERAEAALAYLEAATADGRFFAYGGMYAVAGRVPDA